MRSPRRAESGAGNGAWCGLGWNTLVSVRRGHTEEDSKPGPEAQARSQ